MDSNEKKISIHPDLMFMTSGKTKKNKVSKEKKEQIKMKAPPKTKNHTLRKQSLMRMIRKHQDEKHRQQLNMMSGNPNTYVEPTHNTTMNDTLQFMNNIKDKHSSNQTLKNNNYNTISISSPIQKEQDYINVNPSPSINGHPKNIEGPDIDNPDNLSIQDDSIRFHVNLPQNNIQPKYGCMKDGNLPTYRTIQGNQGGTTHKNLQQQSLNGNKNNNNAELAALQKYTSQKNIQSSGKQRKIIRRTFNVGKKNKEKKISVLISNKKIRSNTTLKIQQFKDVSIYQVKNDLIKRGLIKVGCITPESVLRQMYSVVHSMCGSIQNHNSELLLHNYLNSE